MDAFAAKQQYNTVATSYQTLDETPHGQLEQELISRALGDCTGLRVLDLGGGSGGHARQALRAGASSMDVVDVSPAMLQVGQDTEAAAQRNRIRWHLADLSRPLPAQVPALPQAAYDLVLAVWPFDHARTPAELDAMWRNVAAYAKPGGGRVIGVRTANPYAESAHTGKYGSKFTDVEKIDGGVRYQCVVLTTPPFSFEATSMESSFSGSTEIPEKYGITDFRNLPLDETDVVRKDPEFFEMLVKDSHFVCFTARKK